MLPARKHVAARRLKINCSYNLYLSMSFTISKMLPLGTKAPDFVLPDTVSGNDLSLADIRSDQATVVMFICNHCPYVIHVNPEILRIAHEYMEKGVSFVAISSNDVENYPDDAPDRMRLVAKVLQFPFPYLYDETQEVAKAYDAACTPEFYVFDGEMKLFYRGRIDDSRPGNDVPLSGRDLRDSLDRVLSGGAPPEKQYPSGGCNIKWKA